MQKFTVPVLQYFAAEEKNPQLKKIEELKRNILGEKVLFFYFACIGIKISLVKIKLKPRLKQKGENPLFMGGQMHLFSTEEQRKVENENPKVKSFLLTFSSFRNCKNLVWNPKDPDLNLRLTAVVYCNTLPKISSTLTPSCEISQRCEFLQYPELI